MKTLKDWWSFANDATKLSDAEQVAKGEANWSPLAEQALRESACMIIDRVGPENVPTFCDPKTWALEHHPQAFEELSLAIGAALEAMWSVVPEAKREEFHGKPADLGKWASHRGVTALGPFKREYLGEWVQPIQEEPYDLSKCIDPSIPPGHVRIDGKLVRLQEEAPQPGKSIVRGKGFGMSITMHPGDLLPPSCESRGLAHLSCSYGRPAGQRYCVRCTRDF